MTSTHLSPPTSKCLSSLQGGGGGGGTKRGILNDFPLQFSQCKGKEVRLTFFLILRSYFWAYVRQYTACVLDLDIVLNLFFVMFLNKARLSFDPYTGPFPCYGPNSGSCPRFGPFSGLCN